MNCILFETPNALHIPHDSIEAKYLREVLKIENGKEIFAGIVNTEMFMARVSINEDGSYDLLKTRSLPDAPQLPIVFCAAFTRPQIAKRILFDCSCFGVNTVIFYAAEKGDASYIRSSLYSTNEIRYQLIRGAEQACASSIPEFFMAESLEKALTIADDNAVKISSKFGKENILKTAPDVYESTISLSNFSLKINKDSCAIIAIGGERGFSKSDRELLRSHAYELSSLGKRVLRTDSAAIASLSILSSAFE